MIKIIKKSIIDSLDKIDYDYILVPMSIYNAMNSGFAYDIALFFPNIKSDEEKTPYGDRRKYGTYHIIDKCIMCYMHTGGYKKNNDGSFIDLEALKRILSDINKNYKYKKIVSPVLGSTKYDGNFNKNELIKIFFSIFATSEVDITLYDFEQEDTRLINYRKICELYTKYHNREIDKETLLIEKNKLKNGNTEIKIN